MDENEKSETLSGFGRKFYSVHFTEMKKKEASVWAETFGWAKLPPGVSSSSSEDLPETSVLFSFVVKNSFWALKWRFPAKIGTCSDGFNKKTNCDGLIVSLFFF